MLPPKLPRVGDDHVFHGNALEDLGGLLRQRGAYERAEPYLREAVRIYRAQLGDSSLALDALIRLYEDLGRSEEAARYRALLV